MLNFTAALRDSSRLACQIVVTDALDGLVVSMPDGQH
jgi:2Fe-2S ferredoxin